VIGAFQTREKLVDKLPVTGESLSAPFVTSEQKKRWFRNGQKWRTGCEGRISVAQRRHGLDRCHYKGSTGMKGWVGLGVVADNLMSIEPRDGRTVNFKVVDFRRQSWPLRPATPAGLLVVCVVDTALQNHEFCAGK
jgi:hypothetical protein